MSVRLYWTPILGDGITLATAFRVELQGARCRAPIPIHPRYTADGDVHPLAGQPRLTHTLALARADEWPSVGAQHLLLLPDVGAATPRELATVIGARTLADIPALHRTAWSTMLQALNAKRDDLALTMPVVKLLRRVLVTLDPQGAHVEGFLG